MSTTTTMTTTRRMGDNSLPYCRREDIALLQILWDGHSTSSGVGYVKDMTGPELILCLLVGGHDGDS
jgi:hypothetical protein